MAGCAPRVPSAGPNAPIRYDSSVEFDDGHAMALHLSRPVSFDAEHPLVLFATGDGGWRGKDKAAFEQMTRWGYPLAGFSAPSYIQHLVKHEHTTTPADVARDFAEIIGVAERDLLMPPYGARTLLVGVSRGAGLVVAAAGEPSLQPSLVGVVAVALTREEEYVHRLRRPRRRPQADPELVMLDNYEYLPRLRRLPLSIIQSTHDDYLPAEEARRLLGPDTALRQLHPIPSKNHSFTDAREQLYEQMQASLAWVSQIGLGQDAAGDGQ